MKTYPKWLNVCSRVTLVVLGAGFALVLSGMPHTSWVLAAGFCGVWIFGGWAKRLGRPKNWTTHPEYATREEIDREFKRKTIF